jgi:hypothetical protein
VEASSTLKPSQRPIRRINLGAGASDASAMLDGRRHRRRSSDGSQVESKAY